MHTFHLSLFHPKSNIPYTLTRCNRGMLHNPETYPDPDKFKPERFEGLSKEELEKVDPRGIVFGFGRRCESIVVSPFFFIH